MPACRFGSSSRVTDALARCVIVAALRSSPPLSSSLIRSARFRAYHCSARRGAAYKSERSRAAPQQHSTVLNNSCTVLNARDATRARSSTPKSKAERLTKRHRIAAVRPTRRDATRRDETRRSHTRGAERNATERSRRHSGRERTEGTGGNGGKRVGRTVRRRQTEPMQQQQQQHTVG